MFASLDLFLSCEATILNIHLSKNRSIFSDSGFDDVVFESQVNRKVWVVAFPNYQVKDSAIRHLNFSYMRIKWSAYGFLLDDFGIDLVLEWQRKSPDG